MTLSGQAGLQTSGNVPLVWNIWGVERQGKD
jgi:hypothetical protein